MATKSRAQLRREQWVLKKHQDTRRPHGVDQDGVYYLSLVLLPPEGMTIPDREHFEAQDGWYSQEKDEWTWRATGPGAYGFVRSHRTKPRMPEEIRDALMAIFVLFEAKEMTFLVVRTYEGTAHEEFSVIIGLKGLPKPDQPRKFVSASCQTFNRWVRKGDMVSFLQDAFRIEPSVYRFDAGEVYVTRKIMAQLTRNDTGSLITAYRQGDWGNASESEIFQNEIGLREGGPLIARPITPKGELVITTHSKREKTYICFPDEYKDLLR